MATRTQIQWLFHLPPALRCRIISPLERTIHQEAHAYKRAFSNTTSKLAGRQPKSPPLLPRKPGTSSPAYKTPTRTGPKQPATPPTTASAPPSRPGSSLEADLTRLLATSDRILLYKAPSHKTFFFSSYLFGTILLGGAVVQAGFTQEEREMPWYARLTTSGLAVFLSVMGTVFLLAPSKMIRSVSVARNAATHSRFLTFQTKPAFPFVGNFRRANTINMPLGEVRIDRAIHGAALPPHTSVPIEDAEKFTKFDASGDSLPKAGALRSLLGIWSNLWWDTRRMFLRDGFVYIEIPGQGHWKLDLRNAELLDNGRPLTATMVPASLDRSIVGWLRAASG